MPIIVMAEHQQGRLKPATLSAISAARQLGSELHIVVAGSDGLPAAEQAARQPDVGRVWLANDPIYDDQAAEHLARLLLSCAGNASHVLAAATSFGKNLMPRVAALLDVAQISDIVAIEDQATFVRPIYAGSALATVRSSDAVKVITVRPTAFPPITGSAPAPAPIERLASISASRAPRLVARTHREAGQQDLDSARVIVSGGKGLGDRESFAKLLQPLASRLNAALGASRAAVDAGFVSNDHQIGQTGKVVAPELYIAVGISGAIQHLAGMKEAKVIVAINKDPDAPIFRFADYSLEADLFEAIPELTAQC